MPEVTPAPGQVGPALPAASPVQPKPVLDRLWGAWPLAVIALGACWLLFFAELRGEWEINPQYNYGWAVPLLAVVLVCRRWPDRPEARAPESSLLPAMAGAGLLLLLLPLRLLLEANPEWRLLYWVHGCQLLALTACLLYRAGGWPWVRYFAPAVLFMLIAVPWPMELETAIIQGLMRFVAGLTVEVAGWLGIPAVQHGNLIEVGVGMVGIDEACSGVRSLQSGLMVSLFLGELYRMSGLRRAALLTSSLLFVLVANLCRTSFLVWAATHRGLAQMETWHNAAGLSVMFLVFGGLFGLAQVLKPALATSKPSDETARPMLPALPRWLGCAVLGWLVSVGLATELWYRAHESGLAPKVQWHVVWPSQSPAFTSKQVPEKALAILRCSQSEAASWEDDQGNQWSGFFLHWDPGRNSAQLAKGHRPDICLPATGATLSEDFGLVSLAANGVEMPFRYQTFRNGARLLHVFYCLWSDRISPRGQPLLEDGSRASRLRAVLAGRRNLGQQVLEVVLQGPEAKEEAVALLERQLPKLIQP